MDGAQLWTVAALCLPEATAPGSSLPEGSLLGLALMGAGIILYAACLILREQAL